MKGNGNVKLLFDDSVVTISNDNVFITYFPLTAKTTQFENILRMSTSTEDDRTFKSIEVLKSTIKILNETCFDELEDKNIKILVKDKQTKADIDNITFCIDTNIRLKTEKEYTFNIKALSYILDEIEDEASIFVIDEFSIIKNKETIFALANGY